MAGMEIITVEGRSESDTPRKAGGLMNGDASRAVDPYTQRRAHMKFLAYLTKQRDAVHIPQVCRIPNRVNRIPRFLIQR